jgi:hypothetical protein
LRLLLLGIALLSVVVSPAFGHTDSLTHPELPTCAPGDPRLLLPDLVPDPPSKDRTNRRNGRRIQEFTTAVGNVGDGPLLIEGKIIDTPEGEMTGAWQLIERRGTGRCARFAGTFEFHPSHLHWHFERFVAYEMRKDDPNLGPFAAEGTKASFCLLDLDVVDNFGDGFPVRQVSQMTCDAQEGIQAISVGWKDVYDRTLDEQYIELDLDPPVRPGTYYLVNAVDPDGMLWEKDITNNVSYIRTSVILPAPDVAVERPTRIPTPDLSNRPPVSNDDIRPGRPPRPVRPARPPRAGQPTRDIVVTPTPTRTPTLVPTRPPVAPTVAPTISLNPPRPTRPPRPARPGSDVPARPTSVVVPTQAPRPTLPAAPTATRVPVQPTRPVEPTAVAATPTRPAAQPTATATRVPNTPSSSQDPSFSRCADACAGYGFSQTRLIWRQGIGLDLTFAVRQRNCPSLDFRSGERGAVYLTDWLTTDQRDTGKTYSATFTLDGSSGATSDGGRINLSKVGSDMINGAFTSKADPIAGVWDGRDFPVSFNMCVVVGDRAIKTRLVCQPKSDGALCHWG